MKLIYFSDVKNNSLQKNVSEMIKRDIARFEGKRVEISIQKIKTKRSHAQNRLWWMYITMMADELGYTKDEFHEIAKYKFLRKEKVHEETGQILEYVGSTASLNKSEFSDLVSQLQRWAAQDFSIILPDPGDNFTMGI